MNFTSDIKKELIARGIGEGKSAVSAFLQTSGNIGVVDGRPAFYFVSETENVAEFITSLFFEAFGVELFVSHATRDRMSGRDKLVIECPPAQTSNIAKELGLLKKDGSLREGISSALVSKATRKIAYIQGAFLGGGSCILPSEDGRTGYHLEFVFSEKKIAKEFCRLLTETDLIAKLAERKESYIVYIKSKELISDFLSLIGAESCLKKFSQVVEKRDKANNDNRARNCISGNVDKTAIAAVKQVVAIERLRANSGFSELSVELKTLAKARLANPTMSLQELADSLGVSKSCLNHRMRKLMELAEELKNEPTKEEL